MRRSKKKAKTGSKENTKKTWQCAHGCKMTNQPCRHLESIISDHRKEPLFESVAEYAGDCDNRAAPEPSTFIIPEGIKDRSYEMSFRKKLLKYGVASLTIDILVLHYIYDLNFREISEELAFLSISTAVRLHSEALASLRKRGFGRVRKDG